MQALPILGQNDKTIQDLEITNKQFKSFVDRHQYLQNCTNIVAETNEQMKGSYAMVDPAGRFFDNTTGTYSYSRPINKIGARLAIQQVKYDFGKFIARGGIYNWQNKKLPIKTIGTVTEKQIEYE